MILSILLAALIYFICHLIGQAFLKFVESSNFDGQAIIGISLLLIFSPSLFILFHYLRSPEIVIRALLFFGLFVLSIYQREHINTFFKKKKKILTLSVFLITLNFFYFVNTSPFGFILFSSGNNDLGSYVLQAKNLELNGYFSHKLFNGYDLGEFSQFDHPGVIAALAALSLFFNLDTWQVMMAFLFSTFYILHDSVKLLAISFSSSKNFTKLVPIFVILSPPIIYLFKNGFISQILGICVLLFLLSLCLDLKKVNLLLGALGILSLVNTSVEFVAFGVVFLTLIAFLTHGRHVFNLTEHHFTKSLYSLRSLAFLAVSILAVAIFAPDLFTTLMRNAEGGIAGWKMNVFDPSNLLFMISTRFSSSILIPKLALASLLILLILYIIIETKLSPKNVKAKVSLLVTLLFTLFAINFWGQDGYQTWKLIFTLSPIFFIPFFSLFVTLARKSSVFTFGCIVLMNLVSLSYHNFLEAELTSWNRLIDSRNVNFDFRGSPASISVGTQSMLHNMVFASILLGRYPVSISGPSYFGQSTQNASCNITHVHPETLANEVRQCASQPIG